MTREDRSLAALRRVIGPPPRDLTPTASLRDDLDMDELDIVELVVELEEEFGVAVTEDEGDRLRTWGDVVKLMLKLTERKEVPDGLRSEEARRILFKIGLAEEVEQMTPAEQNFVSRLANDMEIADVTVSVKQLYWLRDLKDKYL